MAASSLTLPGFCPVTIIQGYKCHHESATWVHVQKEKRELLLLLLLQAQGRILKRHHLSRGLLQTKDPELASKGHH
jgi:hypothetical protein